MVKVISLSNKAYTILKEMKAENESFSDVITKLTKKDKKNIMNIFGIAKDDQEFIKGLKEAYKERNKNELRLY